MNKPESLPTENRERKLQGKTALVTGSDRDIGAGIILALAREGANVILHHRDPQKVKRATPVLDEISQYGVKAEHIIADLTIAEERQKLTETIDNAFGGTLDILVLNASGPSRELNVLGNNALIDEILPGMTKGGLVMLMQSTPGHFAQQITATDRMPEVYKSVAASKYEGEQTLLARREEFESQGVSLIIVCPPEVSDTSNAQIFARRDPGFSENNEALSEALGLPRNVTINVVARKVAELTTQKDLQFGYVELFGDGVYDAKSILGQWYGDNAIFVDTVDAENGIGRLIITPQHCKGHFKDEIGIRVFPGHILFEAAAQTLGIMAANNLLLPHGIIPILEHPGMPSRIEKALLPGDVITVYARITGVGNREFRGDAVIKKGRDEVITLYGVTFSMRKIEALRRVLRR